VRKWKGRLLDVDLPHLRAQLEASRDFLFNAAGIPQDLSAAIEDCYRRHCRPGLDPGIDPAIPLAKRMDPRVKPAG